MNASRVPKILVMCFSTTGVALMVGSTVLAALLSLVTHYIWSFAPLLTLCAYFGTGLTVLCAIAAGRRAKWGIALGYLLPLCVMVVLLATPEARSHLESTGGCTKITLTGQFSPEREGATFVEGDHKEELRRYETPSMIEDDQIHYILRDTSGEIAREPTLRSAAWKQAMESLPMGRLIAKSAFHVTRICGAYYDIMYSLEDTEG